MHLALSNKVNFQLMYRYDNFVLMCISVGYSLYVFFQAVVFMHCETQCLWILLVNGCLLLLGKWVNEMTTDKQYCVYFTEVQDIEDHCVDDSQDDESSPADGQLCHLVNVIVTNLISITSS